MESGDRFCRSCGSGIEPEDQFCGKCGEDLHKHTPLDQDHYEVLQVHPSAEPEIIEAAYRRLARMYHPDVNPSEDATNRMKAINRAYSVLGQPVTRSEYDRTQRDPKGKSSEPRSNQTKKKPPPRETGQRTSGTGSPPPPKKPTGTQWGIRSDAVWFAVIITGAALLLYYW